MKKEAALLIVSTLITIFSINGISAQTSSGFTPYGNPFALIYSNINSTFNKEGRSNAFELTRAYLGYEYFFNKTLSSRINFDIGNPGIGKFQMSAYVKNAYLLYKKNGFSARIGMIGTDQFNIQEKQWGYHYIIKSFQDQYDFGPSADLGAAVEYTPVDFITFNLAVSNGEGYKKVQADSAFKKSIGLTLRPFKGFVLRGYYDIMKNNYTQTSMALYAGYTYKNIRTGIEYNNQKNNGMVNNHDFSGISFYTSIGLGEKIEIFGRYDNLRSARPEEETIPWNINQDGQRYIAGFEYSPIKGVKIAPTYLGWSPNEKYDLYTSTIALKFELRF